MLTCNKNFVDLTVWILRSWTCINVNVNLHQSLEKGREPGDGAMDQTETEPTPSSHRQPRPDLTGWNWTYLNWTNLFCLEPEGAGALSLSSVCQRRKNKLDSLVLFLPNWVFVWTEQECSVLDGGLDLRFGWCLEGLNCCMFASDGVFVLMSSCTS